jgi:hypothetical protein
MLRVVCRASSVMLICQSIAIAQTATTPNLPATTAAKPTPSVSTSTATTPAKKPTNTGEIFRWVDKNGKVQYSVDVPEDRRATARKVDTRSNIVSSQVPASISGAAAPNPTPDDAQPTARQSTTEREKCEVAWQQYNAAQACFARFRQGTAAGSGSRGGANVSSAAQDNCKNLPEPAACR